MIKGQSFSRRKLLTTVVALPFLTSCGAKELRPGKNAIQAIVLNVIDATTIIVRIKGDRQVVRLAGCEPQKAEIGQGHQGCGFEAARGFLKVSLGTEKVLLVKNEANSTNEHRFIYHVWLEDKKTLINSLMLQNGFAALSMNRNLIDKDYQKAYSDAADEARSQKVGLYDVCVAPSQAATRLGSPSLPAGIGIHCQVKGLRMAVSEISIAYGDASGRLPAPAHQFVEIQFECQSVRERNPINIEAQKLKLSPSDGNDWLQPAQIEVTDQFAFGTLGLDELRAGRVAFQVPDGSRDFLLEYEVEDTYRLRFKLDVPD